MTVGCGEDAVTLRVEDVVDMVMCGAEALRLLRRLEPPHDLLSSSRGPMTAFDVVVEAFVGTVIGTWRLMTDRFDVAV